LIFTTNFKTVSILWMTPLLTDVHFDCSGIVEHDGVNTDIDALARKVLILDPSISSLGQ
jgi:hypothetical protein